MQDARDMNILCPLLPSLIRRAVISDSTY